MAAPHTVDPIPFFDLSPSLDPIRDQILAEIDRQPWGSRGSVDVIVTNGVVVLKGTIPDERERAALCVAAENVPGVKAVHDRLVWIDTVSGIVIPRP